MLSPSPSESSLSVSSPNLQIILKKQQQQQQHRTAIIASKVLKLKPTHVLLNELNYRGNFDYATSVHVAMQAILATSSPFNLSWSKRKVIINDYHLRLRFGV